MDDVQKVLKKILSPLTFAVLVFILFLYFLATKNILWTPSIYSSYLGDSSLFMTNFGNRILSGVLLFNLRVQFSFIFTGLISYFLIQYILDGYIKNIQVRFVLSLIFVFVVLFAPIRIRYMHEWFAFSNWGWLLLSLIALHKALYSGINKYFILTGITSGLVFLNSFYYGIIIFGLSNIVLILWLLYKLFYQKWLIRHYLINYFTYFSSFLVVFAFGLVKLIMVTNVKEVSDFSKIARSVSDIWIYAAKPWHYFIPDISNLFFGNFAAKLHYKIWDSQPYYLTEPFFPKEHSLYIGMTLFLLSIFTLYLAFIKKKLTNNSSLWLNKFPFINLQNILIRGVFPWKIKSFILLFFVLAILGFLFSMPPYLGFDNIKIYMPSSFMYKIIPQFRVYARFGVIVFISNAVIAFIGLSYLIKNIYENKWNEKLKNSRNNLLILFFFIVSVIFVIEFVNYPLNNQIYATPTPPYEWYLKLNTKDKFMEVPSRVDYTDQLYLQENRENILNPFHNTPKEVQEIYDSLYHTDFSKPDSLWCENFKQMNGKYVFYHMKDINKDELVTKFKNDQVVSEELKVAISESWGYPIFGNHVPKSEEDLLKDQRTKDMLQLLIDDPKFTLIKTFSNKEIVDSRPNKNFSADKFDEVYIFEINDDYCQSYKVDDIDNL